MAAHAILRGETDDRKIAADVGTSHHNVQNVKSVMRKILSGGEAPEWSYHYQERRSPSSPASSNSSTSPASSDSSMSRNDSSPLSRDAAPPAYVKGATAQQVGSEEAGGTGGRWRKLEEARGTPRNGVKIPEEAEERNPEETSLGKQRIPRRKNLPHETFLGGILFPREFFGGKLRETMACLDRMFGTLGMPCAS